MKNRVENEGPLRELFAAARQADAAEAPAYRALVRRARARTERNGTSRRAYGFAVLATAGSLVVVAAAAWLYLADPRQEWPPAPPGAAKRPPVATPLPEPVPEVGETVRPGKTEAEAEEAARTGETENQDDPGGETVPAAAAPTATDQGMNVRVIDSSGPLPGAIVTVESETGRTAATSLLTDALGVAEFDRLEPGPGYTVDVSFPGFASRRYSGVEVRNDETTPLTVELTEQMVERVTVTAQWDPPERVATSTASVITDAYAKELPVSGRFYRTVITIPPGVQDADGDGSPNVHGSRQRDFAATVSGVRNVDPLTGGYMGQVNPNSIDEMEVIPANSGAVFGRAQGGFARIIQAQGREEKRAPGFNTESYGVIQENGFLAVRENPLSTFSIDVDTASFANIRRFLEQGLLPPPGAVRIEEMVNYFRYDYPAPRGSAPFSADVEIAGCPWNGDHRLVRIGLKGEEITRGESAGSNLVFLIDVSGSMDSPNKLPLLRKALGLLVDQLNGSDQLAIVVYAGSSGLVLPSTPGSDKGAILAALDRLRAGGGTNGGEGLRLAYQVARDRFIPGGVNRVVLATDGDFNLGVTDRGELLRLIEQDAREGIFLTALGFGTGNYKDDTLELLADRGNGNYAYIDSLLEARKVLVEEIGGTLVTIAKDVKIQVEFNPAEVAEYRLIGYENRMLRKEDFNDDRKDAGEIGSGHTVTALYEIVSPGLAPSAPPVDSLKYQAQPAVTDDARRGELLTLKIRYKEPDRRKSRLLEFPVVDAGLALESASADFKFAAAVAQFGMILRDSPHKGRASLGDVRMLALQGLGADESGYRGRFLDLVDRAATLAE